MQVADDRLGPQHRFALQLDHQAQYPVRGGMLWAEVQDHRRSVGVAFDTVRVDGRVLRHAQHTAKLDRKLYGVRGPDRRELLCMFVGRVGEGPMGVGDDGLTAAAGDLAHLGPGASLNCTGTRPTP